MLRIIQSFFRYCCTEVASVRRVLKAPIRQRRSTQRLSASPLPGHKALWLLALFALGVTGSVHASSGYYLFWAGPPSTYPPPPYPYYDSLSAADQGGRIAVTLNSSPTLGPFTFGGPYIGFTLTGTSAAFSAINYWFDDAIFSNNQHVGYYFVMEMVCADGFSWDSVAHGCVASPPAQKQVCSTDRSLGDPCDAGTGNESHVETDYTGTGSFPLTFSRTYNSQITGNSHLGFNWTSNYGDPAAVNVLSVTTQATPNFAQVPRPDGRTLTFRLVNGIWTSDADITDTLAQTASGWTYTRRDGTVETYDNTTNSVGNSTGRLIAITNPAGLTQTLSYDPSTGYLNAVSDAFGHSLTFTYDTSGRLSTMIDPNGGTTTYTYDDTNNVGNLSVVTHPDGTIQSYRYSESGYVAATGPSHPHALTGIIDENGNRYASFAYDAMGRAILNQLANAGNGGPQERFALSYDSAAQTTVTDAVNNKEVMTFVTNLGVKNLVSKKSLADNKTLYQTFDANNNLTCKQNEDGRVTTWTYSATNQMASMTEGQGGSCNAPVPTSATRTTTYQYLSPTLDLPIQIQSPSVYFGSFKTVAITYSGYLPAQITQSGFTPSGAAVSRSVTLGYNAYGQVTSIDGPRTDVADVTTLSYYDCTTGGACGQLQRVTNALGQTTTYDSYDAAGRLLQTTDPNGLKTIYAYDLRGRVISINQGGRVTSYAYDALGNVTSAILPSGLTLTYTYNAANYLTQVVDSLGNRVSYSYDLKGNRTQSYTYDPSGTLARQVDLSYDLRNRVSQINTGGSITKQVWDAIGNLTAVTDPNTVAANGTAATANSYDSLNRLFQTVDLLNGNTQYGYDANDRVDSVQAPNGATTQYSYDDLGNLLAETSPDRGTLTYTYDTAGNVRTLTDARGITVNYGYDALNRLMSVAYPDPAGNVTYVYDSGANCSFGIGRLCQAQDAAGAVQYAYDAFGNVVTDTRTELGVAYTTSYAYDAGNRVISITYPDGRQVSYTRDIKGEIQTVSMNEQGVITTLVSASSYRPDGLLLTRSFGNGLTDTRAYDLQGRLVNGFLGSLDTRVYSYDANGNLTSLQSMPQVGAYQYDALNRLNHEDLTTQATTTTAWTYDGNGNRLTQNAGAYSYTSATNRLTQSPDGTLTLDASGNTTSDEGGLRDYSYTQAGTLSQVMISGALAGSYSYDAQNRRTRKSTATGITVYHYDLGGNLLAETDASGNPQRDYVWADGTPIAQIGLTLRGGRPLPAKLPASRLPAQALEVQLVYLHTDQLNTPRVATNPQGQIVWRWDGTAFGETAANEDPGSTGTATHINLRFPGTYWDQESSLLYNGARYRDPKTGRFITADPVSVGEHVQNWLTDLRTLSRRGRSKGSLDDGLTQASIIDRPPLELNPYATVANNPLRWSDPTGESATGAIEWCLTHPAACGGAAAAAGSAAGAAAIGGIGALLYPPALCENEDEERCKNVKKQCIQGCSDFVLQKPKRNRGDLGGMDFHRCVRRCMDDNGC
jgi:RHS repeat-associated protein